MRRADLRFTAAPATEYASSPGVMRGFCARCGTQLTYRRESRAEEIDVTLATLDAAASVAPVDHIYMVDALPWDRPGDGLPTYSGTRPA